MSTEPILNASMNKHPRGQVRVYTEGGKLVGGTSCAGYLREFEDARRPRTVTTAAELDALPVGSVVLDGDGDPWKKRADGLWRSGQMLEESETVFWCGPTPDDHPTVLHEGGAA